MKKLLFGGSRLDNRSDFALTLLRVFAGLAMAFGHGLGKLPVSDRFISGVEDLGFPMPFIFAWAAAVSEFLGGLFLALGLFTRPAAFFVGITMAVAAFIRHADDPFGSKEKAILYVFIALVFLLTGSGKYSLDRVIRKN